MIDPVQEEGDQTEEVAGLRARGGALLTRYRGASLIRNSPPLGPYSRTKPRALWWSWGGNLFLMSEVSLYIKCIEVPRLLHGMRSGGRLDGIQIGGALEWRVQGEGCRV